MTPENFCYWLNGYFEIGKSDNLNEFQIQEIKNHLKLVIEKKTTHLDLSHISKLDSFAISSGEWNYTAELSC